MFVASRKNYRSKNHVKIRCYRISEEYLTIYERAEYSALFRLDWQAFKWVLVSHKPEKLLLEFKLVSTGLYRQKVSFQVLSH